MKNYELFEIVEVCANFVSNPEDEEVIKAFEEMKENLVIKSYMPLRQKEIVWQKVLADIEMADSELYLLGTQKEICLMFDGLLGYIVNLNYDIDVVLKDDGIYDLLVVSGFEDFVLQFCAHDYKRLVKGLDDLLSFRGIKHIADEFAKVNPEALDRLTAEFKRFSLETKPEALKLYADIAALNDPVLQGVKEGVEGLATKAVIGEQDRGQTAQKE